MLCSNICGSDQFTKDTLHQEKGITLNGSKTYSTTDPFGQNKEIGVVWKSKDKELKKKQKEQLLQQRDHLQQKRYF